MTLATELKKPGTLIRIGLVFLILAGLSRLWLRPAGMSADFNDGPTGFLYGVSIASLLVGLWKSRRGSRNGGPMA
jgi:hypothetical protein